MRQKYLLISNKELLIVTCVLVALICSVLYPAINSPFNIPDEHRIHTLNNAQIEQTGLAKCLIAEFKGGRFRPVWSALFYLRAKLLPVSAPLHHVYLVLIGIFTSLVFYCILRNFKIAPVPGFAATAFLAVNSHSEIWYWLVTNEFSGILLLLLSVLFFQFFVFHSQKIHFYLSFLFLLGSALCKESFAALAPYLFICFAVWFLYYKKVKSSQYFALLKQYIIFLVVLLLPVLVIFLMIVRAGESSNYGIPVSYINLFFLNGWRLAKHAMLFVPVLFLIICNPKIVKTPEFIILGCLCLCWIINQLIVHHNFLINGRFFIPALIFPLFVNGVALNYLKNVNVKIYYFAFLLVILLFINTGKNEFCNSSFFAANSKSFHKQITFLKERSPEKILVFTYDSHIMVALYENFAMADYFPELSLIIPQESQLPVTDENNLFDKSQLVSDMQNGLHTQTRWKVISDVCNADMEYMIQYTGADNKQPGYNWSLSPQCSYMNKQTFTEYFYDISFVRMLYIKRPISFECFQLPHP